jgi:hypothetical protein
VGSSPDPTPYALKIEMLDFVRTIRLRAFLLAMAGWLLVSATSAHSAENPREIISKSILGEDAAEKVKLINSLTGQTDAIFLIC